MSNKEFRISKAQIPTTKVAVFRLQVSALTLYFPDTYIQKSAVRNIRPACCLLPAACCLLPAACCLLPAAKEPPTNNNLFPEKKLFSKWSLKPK
jgi:hypothetical protein